MAVYFCCDMMCTHSNSPRCSAEQFSLCKCTLVQWRTRRQAGLRRGLESELILAKGGVLASVYYNICILVSTINNHYIFGKIYNVTMKKAKSTSTIKLFITNLQPNHHQILSKSTIYQKVNPPSFICCSMQN